MLHASGVLSDAERALYETAFDYYSTHAYPGYHGGVVYLHSDARACAKRIRHRDRDEESSITIEYLEKLHDAHETALARPDAWGGARVLRIDVETLGNVPDDDAAADAVSDRVRDFVTSVCTTPRNEERMRD
jgi:deoxyadenosine/deoxycytidine kinase